MDISATNFLSLQNCNICKSSNAKELLDYRIKIDNSFKKYPLCKYLSSQTFCYYLCKNCGVVYLSPVLKKEFLWEYYQDLQINFQRDKNLYLPIFKEITELKKTGNFLDIGFGGAEVLELAKEFGFKTFGVEVNKNSIEQGKELGIEVYYGDFLDVNLKENFFDVISFLSVLEHQLDPILYIKKAHQILKKDGIIVFVVPIFGVSAKLLKTDWLYLSPLVGHIYFFSKKTVMYILRETKFNKIIMKTSRVCPDLIENDKAFLYKKFIKFSVDFFSLILKIFGLGDALLVVAKKI